ncbi:MAG TPA: response regulator [Candidatus Binatia bacterium]|jgi:CheY-like chemotaxis protein
MAHETILLVEDNPVNRRLAEFLLRSNGYKVIEAANAEEAFELLKVEHPALVVMDIQLSGIDGLEATRRIKADPATANIPVLAVTSYAMKGDREKALQAGCAAYITKPIDKTAFIQEITALLAKKADAGRE